MHRPLTRIVLPLISFLFLALVGAIVLSTVRQQSALPAPVDIAPASSVPACACSWKTGQPLADFNNCVATHTAFAPADLKMVAAFIKTHNQAQNYKLNKTCCFTAADAAAACRLWPVHGPAECKRLVTDPLIALFMSKRKEVDDHVQAERDACVAQFAIDTPAYKAQCACAFQ